jgi:hypothetical protein
VCADKGFTPVLQCQIDLAKKNTVITQDNGADVLQWTANKDGSTFAVPTMTEDGVVRFQSTISRPAVGQRLDTEGKCKYYTLKYVSSLSLPLCR